MDETYLERIDTFRTFMALFDNYEPVLGIPEDECVECVLEQYDFLNAVLRTDVMRRTWEFLRDKGLFSVSDIHVSKKGANILGNMGKIGGIMITAK